MSRTLAVSNLMQHILIRKWLIYCLEFQITIALTAVLTYLVHGCVVLLWKLFTSLNSCPSFFIYRIHKRKRCHIYASPLRVSHLPQLAWTISSFLCHWCVFPQALRTRSKDWRLFRLCSPLLVFVSQLSDLHWIQLIFNYPLGFASCKSQKLYEKYKNRCLTTCFSQWPRISCATLFITFVGQYWHIFPSRITLKSLQRFVQLYTVCICHMTQSPMFIILAI